MKKRLLPIGIVSALVVGALVGYFFGANHLPSTSAASAQAIRENSPDYKFVNPLLLAQSNTNNKAPQYEGLRLNLQNYINSVKVAGQADDVSVYLRDMNQGGWTGVNEDDVYAPGSMLKVAILMGYLNEAEDASQVLDQTFYYNPQTDEGQYFKPPHLLAAGTYQARDLLKNMITESDNTATIILANAHPDIISKVYKDLALPEPPGAGDFMSPKQYASFWRVLYNGTYLAHDVSEEALTLLSLTTFKDGLVAGLPAGTQIAHKFGEHTTNNSATEASVHELHDCGIVYPPKKDPYFLCVMTRGSDFTALEKVVAAISKTVYNTIPG